MKGATSSTGNPMSGLRPGEAWTFKPLPSEGLVSRLRHNWGEEFNASSENPWLKFDCRAAAQRIEDLEAALRNREEAGE